MKGLLVCSIVFSLLPAPAWCGGGIEGFVSFQGRVSPAKRRPVTVDAEVCGRESVFEDLVVSDKRGQKGALKDAVVYLEGRVASARRMEGPGFSVERKQCRFEPRVVVVPAGEDLKVVNADPVLHNFHAASRTNPALNRTLPPQATATVRFDQPEIFHVLCDIHPGAGLWVVVAGNPYHAVTGEDGRYRLKDVPAGDYNLVVWHPELGSRVRRLTVREGEELVHDVRFTDRTAIFQSSLPSILRTESW